jgi:hypothetical protein
MIIRIMGEGQYRLNDEALERVSQLDQRVADALRRGDEVEFHVAFAALVGFVRQAGERVADSELVISDHILPHTDATFAEAREAFAEEGAVPG